MLYDTYASSMRMLATQRDPHEVLRENGCHFPSDADVIRVFQSIARITTMKKLAGDNFLHSTSNTKNGQRVEHVIQRVFVDELIPALTGKPHVQEITGNGFEWSGWYSEIYLLTISNIIKYHDGFMWLTRDTIATIQHEDSDFLVHDYVLKVCAERVDDLARDLEHRVRRFGLSEVVYAAAYSQHSQRRPA